MQIHGRCPACGNRTLVRSRGTGQLWCAWNAQRDRIDLPACPAPGAADALLNDPTGNDHIIHVDEDGAWAAKHPLIERLGDLFSCTVPETVFAAAHQTGIGQPGWYKVGPDGQTVYLGVDRPW